MKYNFGLIGHQISYSISPIIHEQVALVLHKDISYKLFDVDKKDLASLIMRMKKNEFQGFNVTKPYKEDLLDYVDVFSDVAKEIKAVNTIYYQNNKVFADNTDVFGFAYLLDYYQIDVKSKRILVLGTGGASKAISYVLKQRGAYYHYASRDALKSMDQKVISYKNINPNDYDIYINATPIGNYPNVNECILKKSQVTNQIVIDLIYRPKVTQLMTYAKKAYNGYIMLLAQAIKSDMLWLGEDLPIHDILDQIKEVIDYE
ncbi:MAG: shikimate dehydrogenase [Acholeplasmataceae bacterium]